MLLEKVGSLYGCGFAGTDGRKWRDAFGLVGRRIQSRDELVLVFGGGVLGRRTFGTMLPVPLPAPARERGGLMCVAVVGWRVL